MTVEERALRQLLAALEGSPGRRALFLELLNISDAIPTDGEFLPMAKRAVSGHCVMAESDRTKQVLVT
jgi:hypothetical protein